MTLPVSQVPWLKEGTLFPAGSSPVSLAEPPAEHTWLQSIKKQLLAEETSPQFGLLFLRDTTWIQSSGEPLQPLSTDFCTAASPLPTYFFPSCSQSKSSGTEQLHHRLRSLGEKARLNSLSSSLLPHACGWQSSVHQGISAPGNYCLWATPLSQSQGFGLVKLCFLSDVQLSQTVFLFQQRVLRVSRRKPVSPYGWCCQVLIIVLHTSVMGRFIQHMGKTRLSFRFSKPVQLLQCSTPFLCQQDDMAAISMAKEAQNQTSLS